MVKVEMDRVAAGERKRVLAADLPDPSIEACASAAVFTQRFVQAKAWAILQ